MVMRKRVISRSRRSHMMGHGGIERAPVTR